VSGPLADGNLYRFSSKEWDGTSGLNYYLYRYYHPDTQRWLNRDPIAEDGSLNLYGFVANSPVNSIDAFGLTWQTWPWFPPPPPRPSPPPPPPPDPFGPGPKPNDPKDRDGCYVTTICGDFSHYEDKYVSNTTPDSGEAFTCERSCYYEVGWVQGERYYRAVKVPCWRECAPYIKCWQRIPPGGGIRG
jgi:RHS repeat-associated protein